MRIAGEALRIKAAHALQEPIEFLLRLVAGGTARAELFKLAKGVAVGSLDGARVGLGASPIQRVTTVGTLKRAVVESAVVRARPLAADALLATALILLLAAITALALLLAIPALLALTLTLLALALLTLLAFLALLTPLTLAACLALLPALLSKLAGKCAAGALQLVEGAFGLLLSFVATASHGLLGLIDLLLELIERLGHNALPRRHVAAHAATDPVRTVFHSQAEFVLLSFAESITQP